jgi:predicted DCC family thiol-disulfide oxidoreductase YuxK
MAEHDGLLLLYDGECSVCTDLAVWAKRKDRSRRLITKPNQTPGLIEECGLTRQQVDEKAWVIDGTRRLSGAAAINRLLDGMGAPWRFLAAPSRLTFLLALEERLYSLLALRRGLLRAFVPHRPQDKA